MRHRADARDVLHGLPRLSPDQQGPCLAELAVRAPGDLNRLPYADRGPALGHPDAEHIPANAPRALRRGAGRGHHRVLDVGLESDTGGELHHAGRCGTPPLGDGGVDAGPSDAGVAGDLPCDVAGVLTGACTSCHGNPPTGGAPMALTSLAQLRASSPSNPAVTNGQACVQRMASTTSPMPPPPAAPVAAAQQSAFSAWVSAGMQAGTCSVDAGTPDPAFAGPPTCTSGRTGRRGTRAARACTPASPASPVT